MINFGKWLAIIVLTLSAVYLAINGIKGWGWFLLVVCMIGYDEVKIS